MKPLLIVENHMCDTYSRTARNNQQKALSISHWKTTINHFNKPLKNNNKPLTNAASDKIYCHPPILQDCTWHTTVIGHVIETFSIWRHHFDVTNDAVVRTRYLEKKTFYTNPSQWSQQKERTVNEQWNGMNTEHGTGSTQIMKSN
jgi:hypothetical protein